MKPLSKLCLTLLLATGGLYAGEIHGKISGNTPAPDTSKSAEPAHFQPIVVWLENDQPFIPPHDTKTISQKLGRFSPDFMVVVKGQMVDMPNDDEVAHNVFSFSTAKKFNLGLYAKGDQKSVTFDTPGLVDVFCSIHRNMHARIFVLPSPYFDVSRDGASYAIKNLPAGTYTLKVWSETFPFLSKEVKIAAGKPLLMNISLGGTAVMAKVGK